MTPTPEPDVATWLRAVRRSHDRLTQRLDTLTETDASRPSYAREWTVGHVASHLGSQAEIFELFLNAGVSEEPAPGGEVFGPIWDRWNALDPFAQVRGCVTANESFVATVERLTEPAARRFRLSMFGTDLDLVALLALRLAEHAVHSWDIEVAFDPGATLAADAVELLVDGLPGRVERAGTPQSDVPSMVVETAQPDHRWLLTTHPAVALTPVDDPGSHPLRLPADAFLMLVNGRLDADRTPEGVDEARVAELRTVFRGF
jgi:uncharacterized protein (TIGR03083 family)